MTGPPAPDEGEQRFPVPSRAVMAGLAADPRLPIWIRRAIVALAVGLLVTLWQGWRLGLTAAAMVAIVDTVYHSKTMALIPAAARVSSAQRRTRRRLYLLRPFGYMAMHARAIPGTDSVIDHLVVGPGGVYALDSERWDRRLPVGPWRAASAAGALLYHGPFSQKDRLAHARWEAAQAATAAERGSRPGDHGAPCDGDLRADRALGRGQPARRGRVRRPQDRQVLPQPEAGQPVRHLEAGKRRARSSPPPSASCPEADRRAACAAQHEQRATL